MVVEESSKPNNQASSEPEPYTPQWFLFNFLKAWTPEDLKAAIEKNVQVDLSVFGDYVVDMVVREVLNWFKQYRPDLYQVLSTDEGIAWLKKNITRILRRD